MKFSPFTQVGNVAFGISPDALVLVAGQPRSERVNRHSQMEFDYGTAIYRFDTSSALVEISVDVPTLELDCHPTNFAKLSSYVREHDQSAFERVGFLVSPRFGIAHDPDFPSWVTAFPQESIDLWRDIGNTGA